MQKFTEEVLREKVLKIEAVMDPPYEHATDATLHISKEAIIETVGEAVHYAKNPVDVVDAQGTIVGSVQASKVIRVLFGKTVTNRVME